MDTAPSSGDLVSVYELVNETRKEIFSATAPRVDQNEQPAELAPPLAVAHWGSADEVYQRIVEYAMPLRNAQGFMKAYALSWLAKGWRVLE